MRLSFLILEDRPEDAELVVHELRRSGFDPVWQRVDTERDYLAHLDPPPDIILADYNMPELDARLALQLLQERGLSVPFIVVSGNIGEDAAVAMMQQGAADYLLKDRLVRLGPAVTRALQQNKLLADKRTAEEELKASEARFDSFMRHSPALAFIKDDTGQLVYVNDTSSPAVATGLCTADLSVFESGQASQVTEEVTTPDGHIRQLLSFRFLFNDAAGRRLLGGVSVDITAQKRTEAALSAALTAKDALFQELQHRVKNNLQTVSSLLNMQAESLSDPGSRQALREAQRRVQSMALIHEQMYGDKQLDELEFGEYARRLASDLFDSFGISPEAVRLRFDCDPVSLKMDQMIPCGLILNELITNSLKYAFPAARTGEIVVSIRCPDGAHVTLQVADNGIGPPAGVDSKQSKSMGLRIVEILAKQLGGTLQQESGPGVTSAVAFMKH
ncbi:MAG: histidine kinase dimerization/phosphoacceptor domain -containing protein [Bryobacteraceae bacterium]|jgi:two-component sensor histidine kinase/DNA-binding NarL/FixJ family response regulator